MGTRAHTIPAITLAVMVALCGQAARAAHEEDYRCPLTGPYFVRRGEAPVSKYTYDWGYQLIKPFGEGGFEYTLVKVKKVAVSGGAIVGTTETGFFILDTTTPYPESQIFSEVQGWQNAMKAAGIRPDIQLNEPDILAAKVPDRLLRPLDYRAMKGLLGLSDGAWSAILLLITAAIIFLRGAVGGPGTTLLPLAILLGAILTVGLIALGIIDLAAFMGFFIYPVWYWIIGKLGRFFRAFIWDPISRRRLSRNEIVALKN